MAQLIHCDGPGCDKTRDLDIAMVRLSTPSWFHVERREYSTVSLDFCSDACMAAWAGRSQTTRTTVAEPYPPGPRR